MTKDVNTFETRNLRWLDMVKAVAIVWIFLNHVAEQIFSYPYIANPTVDWPSFGERLAQLLPLSGLGLWTIPANALRYAGWFGDQGVQLFLIASGFGLTWGLLTRHGQAPLSLGPFYRRRAERVYPLWWGAHLLFMALWLLTGWGLSMVEPATYLSLVGIRLTPELLYYFAPAWWYIGLLIQLYLIYPLLWEALRRHGPLWLLLVGCAVAFVARALGLLLLGDYLDAWLRGAIFVTRLPEFVLGMSLAAWLHRSPERTDSRLRSPRTLLLALALYALGITLSLTLLGMAVAPFLLGTGAFVLLYAILRGNKQSHERIASLGTWLGRHSYSLYLMHHTMILLLVPLGLTSSGWRIMAGILAAMVLTVAGAVGLEWGVNGGLRILGRWRQGAGITRAFLRVAAFVLIAGSLLVGSELLVRWKAPQEVLGWGERPSLEPNAAFGWRLKPSSQTRLRWENYDYQVMANSLGFPGPEYPAGKDPEIFRVLTVGDAFTSAEGVDTDEAWPRLLEADLAGRLPGQQVAVLNFGVTGYGPNQYAAVLKEFVPIYQPDLILIGFFVNEYQDVLQSDEAFRQSIGFGLPPQDSWYAILRLEHLQRLVRLQVIEPLLEVLRGQPRSHGYFLGNFSALERDNTNLTITGRQLVTERLAEIETIANAIQAEVVIAMIPGPVQVCGPEELTYYPGYVDLADAQRFDLEQPQRLTEELAAELGLGYYDLRPTLESVNGCPYQEHNMHWTEAGHRAVAGYLTEQLLADRVVSPVGGE